AGLQTRLLDRLDDYPMPRVGDAAHGHERVENFQQIQL
ncbi:acireductone synthase, partial [Stenotrophomonas sp. MA5]